MMVVRAGIANREDPDQTASSEAVRFGSALYVYAFLVRNFRTFTVSCYKGTILQSNYRKMTILWPFFYNSLVKFYAKNK